MVYSVLYHRHAILLIRRAKFDQTTIAQIQLAKTGTKMRPTFGHTLANNLCAKSEYDKYLNTINLFVEK